MIGRALIGKPHNLYIQFQGEVHGTQVAARDQQWAGYVAVVVECNVAGVPARQ